VERHLAENIYDYLPWIFKYSTGGKVIKLRVCSPTADNLRCFLAFHKGQTIYFKGVLWFSWSQNYFCARNKRHIFCTRKINFFLLHILPKFFFENCLSRFYLCIFQDNVFFSINFGDKKFQNNQLYPDGSRYYF
jgi:hypothetical protein